MRAEFARQITDENREPRYHSNLEYIFNVIKSEAEQGRSNTCVEPHTDLVGRLTIALESLGYVVDCADSILRISWGKNEK